MDIKEQRQRIIDQVNNIDNAYVLRQIEQLLDENMLKEPVVAYSANGQPLTKKDLIARIEKAEEDIKNGDYLSQEDFERESDQW